MAYYLGIDGGGSKTACAVGDETSLLATATSGPSNVVRVGEGCARESLHEAIRAACTAARIDPRQVQRACVGAAGAGREEIAVVLRKMMSEVMSGEIDVVGDMEIALQAAFGAGPGVIVIAGTGSIAYGRDARGGTVRAGGWGFAISDEGSSHWIGRRAISALLRAADQSPPAKERTSPLFRELAAAWKVDSIEQLARTANSTPDFATLLPAVLAAADAGDEQAQEALTQAAAELARLASIVLRRLFPEPEAAIPLAVAGGVFRHAALVREQFIRLVRTANANIAANKDTVEPVLGALNLARRLSA